MKYSLILLISIILFSCAGIHKTAYTSFSNNRYILHKTLRPDTCKPSRLTYVYWRWKKDADTTYKMNVSYTKN